MSEDKYRGTGRTTQLMKDAPLGAHYVWLNYHFYYPLALAEKIGRADLKIVGPGYFDWDKARSLSTRIIIDHAAYPMLPVKVAEAIFEHNSRFQ